jgi:hypothetical protein
MAVIRRPVSKFLAALTDLLALLEEAGAQVNFYVVGGAALGLGYGARSALTDIDARMLTSTASQKLLDEAIAKVADKHDLQSDWINAKASSHFVSDEVDDPAPVTLSESKSGKLVVQVASLDVLVAMKIHAGRPQIDRPDLEWLFSELSITTEQEAVERHSWYFPEHVLKSSCLELVRAILNETQPSVTDLLGGAT